MSRVFAGVAGVSQTWAVNWSSGGDALFVTSREGPATVYGQTFTADELLTPGPKVRLEVRLEIAENNYD